LEKADGQLWNLPSKTSKYSKRESKNLIKSKTYCFHLLILPSLPIPTQTILFLFFKKEHQGPESRGKGKAENRGKGKQEDRDKEGKKKGASTSQKKKEGAFEQHKGQRQKGTSNQNPSEASKGATRNLNAPQQRKEQWQKPGKPGQKEGTGRKGNQPHLEKKGKVPKQPAHLPLKASEKRSQQKASKVLLFLSFLCSLFSVLFSLFSFLCSLFSVLCSLFSVLCSLFSFLFSFVSFFASFLPDPFQLFFFFLYQKKGKTDKEEDRFQKMVDAYKEKLFNSDLSTNKWN